MSISYPLILPASPPGLRNVEFGMNSVVGMSQSPFTGSQQVYEYPGEWWDVKASLPPMKRAAAERWIAWMAALRGRSGTFVMGDPLGRMPKGLATGIPLINGASQVGKLLITDGWTPNIAGILKAGDYIQLGGQNLLLWSEDFTNAVWSTDSSGTTVTSNTTTAPDGTVTADTVTSAFAGGDRYQSANIVSSYSLPFTFSVWMKVASGTQPVRLSIARTSGLDEEIKDITVTTSWQRFSITHSTIWTGISTVVGAIRIMNSGASVFCWGGQFEQSLTAGNYVKTTSTASDGTITRLHKIVLDANSDSSGNVTLDIWPSLRESPSDNSMIGISSCNGIFRLTSNRRAWTVDVAQTYGLGFEAMEAF